MTPRRALTVRQPWADLIMAGVKPVENRTRPVPSTLPQWCSECGMFPCRGSCGECAWTPFPFRLWIHAGLRLDRAALAVHLEDARAIHGRFGSCGVDALADTMTYGALLGTVEVTGCHHADECHDPDGMHDTITGPQYHPEAWCSRWAEPDRWHWTLTDPRPLDTPVPATGRQGLWRIPEEVAA